MKLIAKGAEGEILKIDNKTLKKIRTPKTYRIPILDAKLRKFRNKREVKVLIRLFENSVNVPKVYEVNENEFYFTFEYLDGKVLKEVLNEKKLKNAFNQIIKMHNLGIVHNDLTTLNMIDYNNKIYLFDFGLSDFSIKIEDRAVDLNLFFNCIKNEHPTFYKHKETLLKTYEKDVEKGNIIIKRLEEIEKRGRNK